MAYKLKAGKTYTDPHEQVQTIAYSVFYQNNGNKRNSNKVRELTLEIYPSENTAKNSAASGYESVGFTVNPTDWDTYFSEAVLAAVDTSLYSQQYVYLDYFMQAEIDANAGLDPGDPDYNSSAGIRGNFIWVDWESDES